MSIIILLINIIYTVYESNLKAIAIANSIVWLNAAGIHVKDPAIYIIIASRIDCLYLYLVTFRLLLL